MAVTKLLEILILSMIIYQIINYNSTSTIEINFIHTPKNLNKYVSDKINFPAYKHYVEKLNDKGITIFDGHKSNKLIVRAKHNQIKFVSDTLNEMIDLYNKDYYIDGLISIENGLEKLRIIYARINYYKITYPQKSFFAIENIFNLMNLELKAIRLKKDLNNLKKKFRTEEKIVNLEKEVVETKYLNDKNTFNILISVMLAFIFICYLRSIGLLTRINKK